MFPRWLILVHFLYMYAILPPEGQVYSSTHLESGLALVTCLTNRRYQKWYLGTFKARSWHAFAASIYLSTLFFGMLSRGTQSGNPDAMLWETQARWRGPAELSASNQHQLPAMWVSEEVILDITAPADIIRRKTQAPGIWTQSSYLQPLEPLCLKP